MTAGGRPQREIENQVMVECGWGMAALFNTDSQTLEKTKLSTGLKGAWAHPSF